MDHVIEPNGVITDGRNGPRLGYIKDNVVYAGGNSGFGGRQVGYIKGDVIYAGGNNGYGGTQVGYISGDYIFEGGNNGYGGRQVERVQMPHPRWKAAAYFLLT